MKLCLRNVSLFLLLMLLSGCDSDTPTADIPQKPARPVSVVSLQQSSPARRQVVTGSVVPWKAERIGFEQAGRVAEVIEPNESVVPQIEYSDADSVPAGTPLARLDDEQLEIAVESASANVAVAERNHDVNRVAIEQRLPALIASAEAEAELARLELDRAERLSKQNAISTSEFDEARTRVATSQSRVASARADLAQAEAQQLALEAQVLQARQQLSEAQRNLRNSVLFSPFPGQIAEIHAIPGTYVREGDPVVTVQMMDPMAIEFEVTARDSRRYLRGDMLSVQVVDGSGMPHTLSGMVYQVDAAADPAARTFTVTLHVRNEIDEHCEATESAEGQIARTDQIMPLNIGPMITGDRRMLVVREAVHEIGGETFVWKITNRQWGTPVPAGDRILEVTKVPVRITSGVIPFLGKWKLVAIEFTEPSAGIDVDRDLITGRLYFQAGTGSGATSADAADQVELETWTDRRVVLHDRRWLLRSGDVAQITLTPRRGVGGFYVPMRAVRQEQGSTFIHLLERGEQQMLARRVYVDVDKTESAIGDSVQLRITAVPPQALTEGAELIVEGTHYLQDGDRVQISRIPGGL